jgi:hypothetical protein
MDAAPTDTPAFEAPTSIAHRLVRWARRNAALLFVGTGLVLAAWLPPPRGPAVRDGEVPTGYSKVGFEVLAGFDTGEDPYGLPPESVTIPSRVKALDGERAFLKGFMLPLNGDDEGVTEFLLNAAQDMCFFGAPVRVNDFVHVKMASGTRAVFSHLPIAVWGRLTVAEVRRDGRVVSLYLLDAEGSRTGT